MSQLTERLGSARGGLAFKAPCRLATTANITLSGLQTIDGVTVVADDRVLVKNQTTGSENGIYLAKSTAWVRARDFDGGGDAVKGTRIYVHSGATQSGEHILTTADGFTIGTTSLAFSLSSAASTATIVSVTSFGAVGDGSTDDTAAFVAAFAYLATLSGPKSLYIPRATSYYKIATLTSALTIPSDTTIYGDGPDTSVVKFIKTGSSPTVFMGRAQGGAAAENITVRDLHLRGDHDTDYAQTSHYPLLIASTTNLTIRNIRVSYSRVMGIVTRACESVTVQGCHVIYCARDGINTSACTNVVIADNRVEFCDDDGIAHHSQIYALLDRGITITGNTLRFCHGMRVLGLQSGTIVGNTIEFFMAQGISVQSIAEATSQLEGVTPNNGVVIANNIIKNPIDRRYLDSLNSTAYYIIIGGDADQAGGLSAIPGENKTSDGTVIDPYPYFQNNNSDNDDPGDPIPGNYNIIVEGNVCVRDITTLTNISDLGLGQFYIRTGPSDPAITSTYLRQHAVLLKSGILKNALIRGNVAMGIDAFVVVENSTKLTNVSVDGNVVYDASTGVSFGGSNTFHHHLRLTNNTFDLDPLLVHANRGANGTWLANGAPNGVLIQSAYGVIARGNTFRNLCRVSDHCEDAGTDQALWIDNLIEGEPAAVGFSTSSRGVGNWPRSGSRFLARIVDSNPSNATYGDTLNVCQVDDTAIPSAGTFVIGHFVRNNSPSTTTPLGWIRITTGSGHTLNTDWLAVGGPVFSSPITVASATATPAGGSTSARMLFGTTSGFGLYYGSGAPTVSAAQGSLYLRSDGSSTSTRLYVNTNGSTTWTNVTTAA
jgi:hypothetical protein